MVTLFVLSIAKSKRLVLSKLRAIVSGVVRVGPRLATYDPVVYISALQRVIRSTLI